MNLREWARETHRAISNQPAELYQRHLSTTDIERVLRMSIDVLATALSEGRDLRIDNLGRLWVETKAARIVANNLEGKPHRIKLQGRPSIRYRPSTKLLSRVNPPKHK